MISPRRLYLTADRSLVVEEGDKRAASLLICAGGEIPDDVVRKFGLVGLFDGSTAAAKEVVHPPQPPPVESQPQPEPEVVQTFKRRGRPPGRLS